MASTSKGGATDPETPRDRCVTGISGLDDILHGGIPKGDMVLIAGSVGTGKTTLCLEFLLRGAERGEQSMFISVTESTSRLIENLADFEFFRQQLLDSGALVFVELPSIYERLGLDREQFTGEEIELLTRSILGLVAELGVKRVAIDSLTSVIFRIGHDEHLRAFILGLGQGLNRLGCTTLLVSELPAAGGRYSAHGIEEALVDGVIVLGNASRQGDILRVLQVIKMRGTSHSRAQYVVELSPVGLLMAPHLKGNRLEGA